ncbi:MAG: sugar phosphate isomerase/epimerase family protein [Candidatus Bipolaricaulia bacterium]
MKIGVHTPLFRELAFEEMLDRVVAEGLEAIEPGTGNYPGTAHCNPEELLNDERQLKTFKQAVMDRGLIISALSCHGNPIHPDEAFAKRHHETFERTVRLAEKLEVGVICLFSGCPGDSERAKYPNWVTCAWPEDFRKVLEWQWEEVLIPYWTQAARLARDHGVKLAFEMHPGFMIYNPGTLLRLRDVVGPEIGANFDPSHLFWQGIDPVAAIKRLGEADALFHIHAKDTYIDPQNTEINGVLDTTPYRQVPERSWYFRTVGYGHGESTWRDMISALRMIGYDYVLSIEHEDALASVDEGLRKAVQFLKACVLTEPPAEMWWA